MFLTTRQIRIVVQWSFFLLWISLIVATRHPIDSWLSQTVPVSFFLRADPLVTVVVCGGMRLGIQITFLGLVTWLITFVLGRVFCGWVCPLGALFDAFGWFLQKLKVPFEGPSPWYYRFKYYLLLVILVFAVLGGVSPLMGFDPIVLLTRTAAVVLNPFLLRTDEIIWRVDELPGYYGHFVDSATLILFVGIFVATTKVSRIWCRVACPLGAFLAASSRNSVLRRDTEGCVHCNICAIHCPTGAIDFRNEKIYNESECIKCFSCSSECPVDANFFTFKSPVPAVSPTQHPVALNRRSMLLSGVFTLAAAPVLRLAGGEPKASKSLVRPPFSREERDFLASCIRCTECIKACPTGILKPAGFEHGVRALWSPVMVSSEGYCQEGCHACSEACPTDAIMKYDVEDKYQYKAGTAVFESNRCVSFTENKYCSECIKECPTDAIAFSKGWIPEGGSGADVPAPEGQTPHRPTHILYERCVGCGACEYVCNKIVFGESAMIITAQGRAEPTVLDEDA